MAQDSSEEKTETASPKRRQEAREQGNVPKSVEINSVLVLLASMVILKISGDWMCKKMADLVLDAFSIISVKTITLDSLFGLTKNYTILFLKITLPLSLAIMIVGIVVSMLQVGILLTFKPIEPKFEKINPLSGLKRLFSMRSMIETLKNCLKLCIICIVVYVSIQQEFDTLMLLSTMQIADIWQYTISVSYTIVMRIILILIILAIFDYLYQRYDYEKNLRMSKQEVKEERKQMDGDPQIKSRIRSMQREIARRRMMAEVPKATVVVTNPTHYAIAIRYESLVHTAPIVVAKGKELTAQKIKEIALENAVPIIEDPLLVRSMYDLVTPGDPIPMQFYTAIAEILAYVYKLKQGTTP